MALTNINPRWMFALLGASYAALRLLKFARADADLALLGLRENHHRLQGKVVWVTGASSGIGAELGRQLNKAGAYVILSARRGETMAELIKGFASPDRAAVLPMDMCNIGEHTRKVAEAWGMAQQWGKEGVDILVNNAGRSERGMVEEHLDDVDVERELMELNYLATVSLTKLALKSNVKHIVNMSSVAGKMGAPVSAAYSGTKHALQGWSNSLRYELLGKVPVTNICPGPVATPGGENSITPSGGRLGPQTNIDAGKQRVDRACHLMLTAIANEVDEAWVSVQPILAFVYLTQYFPWFASVLGGRVVPQRIQRYKSGTGLYSNK